MDLSALGRGSSIGRADRQASNFFQFGEGLKQQSAGAKNSFYNLETLETGEERGESEGSTVTSLLETLSKICLKRQKN